MSFRGNDSERFYFSCCLLHSLSSLSLFLPPLLSLVACFLFTVYYYHLHLFLQRYDAHTNTKHSTQLFEYFSTLLACQRNAAVILNLVDTCNMSSRYVMQMQRRRANYVYRMTQATWQSTIKCKLLTDQLRVDATTFRREKKLNA